MHARLGQCVSAGPPSGHDLLKARAVHALTASGAVLGLLALHAAVDERWTAMFFWLACALVVDGVDGSIARMVRVEEVDKRFSGALLDLVVDYFTYVVVPTYALVESGMLPGSVSLVLGALILVTSAFYFADTHMKTEEGGFRGFPALWNLAAFLLFVFMPPPWLAAAVVVVLAAATFAPFVTVHPMRVKRFRTVTLAMLAVWCVAASLALHADLAPGLAVKAVLAVASLYFLGIGFVFGKARPAAG